MVVLEISLPNCVFVTPVSLMNKQEIEIFVRLKKSGFHAHCQPMVHLQKAKWYTPFL